LNGSPILSKRTLQNDGRIKCEKCGTEVEVEIKDGKVVYARKVK